MVHAMVLLDVRRPSVLAAVLVTLAVWPAVAQEGRFDAQAFRPLGAPQDVVAVGQSRALSPSSVAAGAFLHFALDPLVLKAHGSEVKALSVVGPRLQLDVAASMGVTEGVEAGLTVPLVLAQGSDNLEALGSEGKVRSFALGDVRLRGKVAIPGLRRRAEEAGWGAALTLGVGLPTGSREAFAGEGALTWTPGAVVDYRFDSGALLALDAGLWLRPSHEFLGVRWGNAATLGLGAEVPVSRGLGVTAVGTLTGSTPLETRQGQARQVPVEGLVGLRWYSPMGLTFTVGGGGGCGCSLTAPTLRFFSSVVWVPYRGTEWHALERYKQPPRPPPPTAATGTTRTPSPVPVDTDGDGVVDGRDACPRHAAGPEGREGCPRVRVEGGHLVLLEPVRFATGQEVPLPDSLPLLEEVAALLLSHRGVVRVRVEASTAPGPSEALALALARRRAATVRRHLLDSGVAEERLCAVGLTREPREGGTGQHLAFVVESGRGSLPPCPGGVDTALSPGEMEGAREVRNRATAAARRLRRLGAWLVLGLRVEGERVRLLGVRAHEGAGAEVDAARAEDLRPLLEAALYHYVRGHQGEVVLTLRRGQGMWTEEALSTGPVLQASVPQAPYEAFLRNQGQALQAADVSEEARREGFTALKRMGNWLLLQPDEALEKASSSPRARYVELLDEERQREVRWQAVQRKLAEYEEWGRRMLATYSPPPRRVAPGYLVSELPLREQSLRALGDATLAWAYAHTEDPDFLKRTPEEVALYLLASRSALAHVVHLGRTAPVHLDYTEALDPEVYTTEELLLELLVGLTPGAGEVTDAHAAYSGRSLTGHALGDAERVLCAVGVVLPLVNGKVLKEAGEAGLHRFALLTGRSLEVQVLSRVVALLSPTEAREVERLMAAAAKGQTFSDEELRFLQRVARGLEAPLREATEALKAGQKVPLLGARSLADGSRLLPGSPAHKAQRWIDYQFRHPDKYRHFSFQPDPDWERMYDTLLKNRPAGNAFENAMLQTGKYERNTAMMMPPPGSGTQGFMPDSVKGNPVELVWGQPYPFVEAKARKELSLSGNLEAMIDYIDEYGGHIELWVRSAQHADGPTRLSGPLLRRLRVLQGAGKASVRPHP
jgi:outer membrane protein OmpA-like peptidoglycan-associated protein